MSYPRWRKRTNCRLPYWELKVGRFEATVLDETPDGGGYVAYVNTVQVSQKLQRTARQAKVVALLAIRNECKHTLELTEHMERKY